jgi:hypothetical protein
MPLGLGFFAVAGASSATTSNFQLLETNILSSAVSTVTFSNIDTYSGFTALQLRIAARSSTSGGQIEFRMRLNGDSGTNYSNHYVDASGTTPGAGGSASQTSMYLGTMPGSTVTTNAFGSFIFDILGHNLNSRRKVVKGMAGMTTATSTAQVAFVSGMYLGTGVISSLTLVSGSGNFLVNSRFSLYGVN